MDWRSIGPVLNCPCINGPVQLEEARAEQLMFAAQQKDSKAGVGGAAKWQAESRREAMR